jgi:hypothetical protein
VAFGHLDRLIEPLQQPRITEQPRTQLDPVGTGVDAMGPQIGQNLLVEACQRPLTVTGQADLVVTPRTGQAQLYVEVVAGTLV